MFLENLTHAFEIPKHKITPAKEVKIQESNVKFHPAFSDNNATPYVEIAVPI